MLKETGIKRIIQYVINVRYALENSGRLSAKNIKIQDINTVNNWPLSIKNFSINYDLFILSKWLGIIWKINNKAAIRHASRQFWFTRQ